MKSRTLTCTLLALIASTAACSSTSDRASSDETPRPSPLPSPSLSLPAPLAPAPRADDPQAPPPPLVPYMVVGAASLRLDALGIGDRAVTGCEALRAPAGSPVTFATGVVLPRPLLDWLRLELAEASSPPTRVRLGFAAEGSWKCALDVDAPSLRALLLHSRPKGGSGLAWEITVGTAALASGGVFVASGDVDSDGLEDVPAALLVPAVQKVVATPPPSKGYPIFRRGVLAPSFEVTLDVAARAAIFGDGEGKAILGPAVLALHGSAPDIVTGAGSGGNPPALVVELENVQVSSYAMSSTPRAKMRLAPPLSDETMSGAKTRVASLVASHPATVDLATVGRLTTALANQPAPTSSPRADAVALSHYWRGDPTTGSPGARTSFDAGLEGFVRVASDVEGLWAYESARSTRPSSSRASTRLGSARALAAAALLSLEHASFPMGNERGGHDYRLARGAVLAMLDLQSGKGAPLAGIDPDEIDLAVVMREASASVAELDAAGRRFRAALDRLFAAPIPTAADITDVGAESRALATVLEATRAATEARFSATR